MNSRREELAWAAGFFEGEGTYDCHRSRGLSFPRMTISQNDREPLDHFAAAVGLPCSIYWWEKREIYSLAITRFEHVQAVVCYLWPWLSTRRRKRAVRMLRSPRQWSGGRPPPVRRRAWVRGRPRGN